MVIRRRTGWTAQNAPRVLLAVLSVVALLGSGCSSNKGLRADEAATVAEGASVDFSVDGGAWTEQGAGGVIPAGAQVRTHDEEARLVFRAGEIRLSPDAAATLNNDQITLERGEVLIDSDGDLSAVVEDTTTAGAGTYRVSTGLSARVGVYQGAVTVQRPAQEQAVPALRQLDIAQFRLTRHVPLRYVADDVWDRELLGDAIAFDGEAARLTRGMDLELGTKPRPASFYRRFTGRALVPSLAAAASTTRGRTFGPPSDVLLTYFVADAAAGDDVRQTVRHVGRWRSQGARWGLIAVDLGVPADRVVAAIDRLDNRALALADLRPDERRPPKAGTAVAAVDGSVAGGAAAAATGTTTGTTTTTSTSTSGTGGGDDPAPPSGGGTTTGGGGGDDADSPSSDDPLGAVVNEVVDEVGKLPGGGESGGGELPEELDAIGDIIDPGD